MELTTLARRAAGDSPEDWGEVSTAVATADPQ